MEKQTTSSRLKQIMEMRNLRQKDVLELVKPYCESHSVKISKSDLSLYVNGKIQPGSSKLHVIGLALNVSDDWLKGLDVPMRRLSFKEQIAQAEQARLELAQRDNRILCRLFDMPEFDQMYTLIENATDAELRKALKVMMAVLDNSEIEE